MPQHLTLQELFDYQRETLHADEQQRIQQHLAVCGICALNAGLIPSGAHRAEKVAHEKSRGLGMKTERKPVCPEAALAGLYASGELPKSQRVEVEKHLARCEKCQEVLAGILQASAFDLREEEKALLASLPPLDIAAQVRMINELTKAETESQPKMKPAWKLPRLLPLLRPAWAVALFMLVIAGSFFGRNLFREWRGNVHARTGMSYLQKDWTITEGQLRPAGNFSFSLFSVPHSASAGVDSIAVEFHEALAWNANNREAQLGLATFWCLTSEWERADSLLKKMIADEASDFEAWNNLGLVAVQREDTTAALQAFERALQIKPDYAEAAYNRALLLQQLGRLEEAKSAWEEYLAIDPQSQWAEVAQRRMQATIP